jgi:hypothetical protein
LPASPVKARRPACNPKADKADILSALSVRNFVNIFSSRSPVLSSGRIAGRGAKSRLGHPTATQAGHNDGKEPGRIVTAGSRVGNVGNRCAPAESCRSAIDPIADIRRSCDDQA